MCVSVRSQPSTVCVAPFLQCTGLWLLPLTVYCLRLADCLWCRDMLLVCLGLMTAAHHTVNG